LTLLLGDLIATISAFVGAYLFRGTLPADSYAALFPFSWYLNLLIPIIPIWLLVFYLLELYRFWRGHGFWKETWLAFKAVSISSFLLGFIVFALKYVYVSRIFIFSFALFDFFLVIFFRWICRKTIQFFSRKNDSSRIILIIGKDKQARTLAHAIEKHRDMGLQVLGFLSTEDPIPTPKLNGYPVLGMAQDLPQILEEEVVDEVIFAISQEEIKTMQNLFLICEERGITARVILNFFPHILSKIRMDNLEGFTFLTFSTTPKNELLMLLRRIFDLGGSIVLILIFSPLILLVAMLIRLDSPGSIIYRQVRCGLNGRKFILYKFRSMVQEAEQQQSKLTAFNLMDGPVFKMIKDPRVTRVGRFLRKTSLDELPQLFNVLRGQMSFVGPRPPLPEEVEKYEGWQRRRMSMKPGITGLWQVSGRNQTNFDQWMKLDLEYIDNWSLWLDVKILLKTIPVVLSGKGAM